MAWYASAALYLWNLFVLWIKVLFVLPFQHTEMLWILVPIWLSWFFAEFFQEKLGTSLGNAISNSIVIVWGSIDWLRQTLNFVNKGIIIDSFNIISRYALAGAVFIYGMVIIVLGIRGNKIIRYIGRVREVTYVLIVFTPMFYNEVSLSFELILAAFLFFPIFYFTIEIFDRYAPNPKAMDEDMGLDKDQEMGGFNEQGPPNQGEFGQFPNNNFGNDNFENFNNNFGPGGRSR